MNPLEIIQLIQLVMQLIPGIIQTVGSIEQLIPQSKIGPTVKLPLAQQLTTIAVNANPDVAAVVKASGVDVNKLTSDIAGVTVTAMKAADAAKAA